MAVYSLFAIMIQEAGAEMATIKVTDPDSGEMEELEECITCGGAGGWDVSTDCEVYDAWESCDECHGEGFVELGHFNRDKFITERDAFTPND